MTTIRLVKRRQRRVPRIILASASPRRAELLQEMGVKVEIIPTRAAEIEGGHLDPLELALTNACRKAVVVSDLHPDALVIGADTVVTLGGRCFGKPADNRAAARMLRALSGKTHEVITGVCLMRKSARDLEVFAEISRVQLRRLTSRTISDYLAKVDVLDKAGAYAIQEHGEMLVKGLAGSFSNVVGLPVERLQAALSSRGLPCGARHSHRAR
ncbi:MAG: Maf family protein [Planctomycetota bacterium]